MVYCGCRFLGVVAGLCVELYTSCTDCHRKHYGVVLGVDRWRNYRSCCTNDNLRKSQVELEVSRCSGKVCSVLVGEEVAVEVAYIVIESLFGKTDRLFYFHKIVDNYFVKIFVKMRKKCIFAKIGEMCHCSGRKVRAKWLRY